MGRLCDMIKLDDIHSAGYPFIDWFEGWGAPSGAATPCCYC
jgi:hypothetical protein